MKLALNSSPHRRAVRYHASEKRREWIFGVCTTAALYAAAAVAVFAYHGQSVL